ncbi:MAG: hypothetical protein NTX25_11405, partial [Proteobacteria bacterium]|nr:hypothetical protein [Pseudomonadota bacterium]
RTKQLQNWKKITDRFLLIRGLQNEANDPRLAFSKIVQLTDAVGTLQQSVHTLQGKTQRMNAWLKQANKRLLLHRPIASPLAEDLRRTAQKLDSLGLEDLHRSKSRLALARKYLEKYLSRAQFLASAQEDQ